MNLAALIISSIALTTWVFTLVGVGYVLWRYAYTPWTVMRKDLTAINQKVDDNHQWVKAELGLREARVASDEDLARAEAVMRRNQVRSRLLG